MPTIVPLTADHAEDAARLFLHRYSDERRANSTLFDRTGSDDDVAGRLTRMLATNPGVAALDGRDLVGHLAGWQIDGFKGPERGVYCPEWASVAVRASVQRSLYAEMSRVWVAQGVANHVVCVLAHDSKALDAWNWDGFGMHVVDAIRTIEAMGATAFPGVEFRKAAADDLDHFVPLADALAEHVMAAPVFCHIPRPRTRDDHADRLAEPSRHVWLAMHGTDAIGYIQCETPLDDVAFSVLSPTNVGVSGAFVRPDWRGRGVATALLECVLAWGREAGMTTCSVDFESSNIHACRMWLRHFQPVCYSLLRRVDPRMVTSGPR
jgi:GNAT superfamily N-acetyltransferase